MDEDFETGGVRIPLKTSNEELQHPPSDDSNDDGFFDEDEDQVDTKAPKSRLSKSHAKVRRKLANKGVRKPLNASLRPANDVLARIRHDPEYNAEDFVVGYSDRHLPHPVEIAVTAWKGRDGVDEEDWIPQHRILYFRRRDGHGEKVWDRATRLDKIFNSGIPERKDEVSPKEHRGCGEGTGPDPEVGTSA